MAITMSKRSRHGRSYAEQRTTSTFFSGARVRRATASVASSTSQARTDAAPARCSRGDDDVEREARRIEAGPVFLLALPAARERGSRLRYVARTQWIHGNIRVVHSRLRNRGPTT